MRNPHATVAGVEALVPLLLHARVVPQALVPPSPVLARLVLDDVGPPTLEELDFQLSLQRAHRTVGSARRLMLRTKGREEELIELPWLV